MVSHVETCSSSLLFVQSSGFEGNVCQVQRQWKPMVAILIPMKINRQEDQIVLAQRSLVRKKSLLTMVCLYQESFYFVNIILPSRTVLSLTSPNYFGMWPS
jgi:hypothetical protein